MAISNSVFLLFSCFLLQFLSGKSQEPLIPALYVFGDSQLDSGNNNNLNTYAKVNYHPYGIDFPSGVSGRFTNGKTFVDFLTELLGLPYVPPYMALSEDEKKKTTTGVNYASGSAGILRITGTAVGENICLDDQIKYFGKTLENDLPKNFKSQVELSEYLSKSIFLINMGCNDYLNNYLQPARYNSSTEYTPEEFAKLLIRHLKGRLEDLYEYGARKFIVSGLPPLGCSPAVVFNARPNTPCFEFVNNITIMFNERFSQMIQQLNSTFEHSTFVVADIFDLSYEMVINHDKYGLTGGGTPCCAVGESGLCLPNQQDVNNYTIGDELGSVILPEDAYSSSHRGLTEGSRNSECLDRTKHFYYDAYHPAEVVVKRFAIDCFSNPYPCVPINIQQLAYK